METSYDIFKNDPSGVLWVESGTDPKQITERLKILHDSTAAEYFAYSVLEAKIIAKSSPQDREPNRAYDVFKEADDGRRIWVETIIGLNQVEKRLLKLSSAAPGTYLIYDPTEAQFVEPFKKSA